jgi:hypothetical protein
MTLITFQDGAVVFRDGQVGTEQACCCEDECEGCFVDVFGVYAWTFTAANCNGSAVNVGGTLTDGSDTDFFLSVVCTEDGLCLGDPTAEGLFINLFAGGCGWRGFLAGDIFQHACSDARTIVGTFTLTNCATGQTGTLVIS